MPIWYINMRKTICLVTNWYPTKQNPYMGVFFREQAIALSDVYNFIVLHIKEKKCCGFNKNYEINKINTEYNIVEYDIKFNKPILLCALEVLYNLKKIYIDKQTLEGVGKFIYYKRIEFTKDILEKVFKGDRIQKFDYLYCVDAQSEAPLLYLISKITGKPYIIGEHAPFPWPGSVLSDFSKKAIENADLFLAISNDKIRQILLQNIKLPPIRYVGNLIDETKMVYRKDSRPTVKTFIIVAAHSFFKNYDLFIKVINRLTEITTKDFKVMVVGYGANKGYSKNVDLLEKKITGSRFADRAELIPEVAHDEIVNLYNRADAFVMTSIQEGQPVSALEAACCGLPIFSTRCGGVEDYVDERIGRIYNITDYEGMAQGLKDFLEDRIVFNSQLIRDIVISKFGRKAFTENFSKAFKEVDESVHDNKENN